MTTLSKLFANMSFNIHSLNPTPTASTFHLTFRAELSKVVEEGSMVAETLSILTAEERTLQRHATFSVVFLMVLVSIIFFASFAFEVQLVQIL